MAVVSLKLSGRSVPLQKSVMAPAFGARTVLTNNPWTYVSLWLKRNKHQEALFYWEQAQHFYRASIGLPMQSSPLLLYYSFMNAAKALLAAKNVKFNPRHGVTGEKLNKSSRKLSLANEGGRIKAEGIVPALSSYFQEPETAKLHSLQDLLFNLNFIHRTYSHTFVSHPEMYCSLSKCQYVFDQKHKTLFLEATFPDDIVPRGLQLRLPASLNLVLSGPKPCVRSRQSIPWKSASKASQAELSELALLHRTLRLDVQYIAGAHTLWYIKRLSTRPKRILRFPPTMVLAAMHRLSEICRYRPKELESFLDGTQTWLLSEFLAMSPPQFLDEIASEITGYPFLIPNVRTP